MSDHYHSEYAYQGHDHDQSHDHDGDYAERYHDHPGQESLIRGLREDLGRAEARISELEDGLRDRIHVLEDRQPDYADPDEPTNREIEPDPPGWYDVPDPQEHDPGPEVDDEGGMSEYRGWLP